MEKSNSTNSTNSSNLHQTINIILYNFYNLRPIVKLFFFITYPQYYSSMRYRTNHFDGYVKNYTNNIYKYDKYPMITHNNYKNLKKFDIKF